MIEYDDLWSSLPIPAILVDQDDLIIDSNPAAEGFLNNSRKALIGQPVWDKVLADAPLEHALQRTREYGVPFYINDVDVSSGERAPVMCGIQIASVTTMNDALLVLIQPRENAHRMNRGVVTTTAGKSAIGMAEMLAHEIKNPLAGITGAAQLLSMNLSQEDIELTDLIVAESRRIVKLLEQVEQFGQLRPSDLKPINIHDALDRARRSAMLGFGAHMYIEENYDPSLPQTLGDMDQLVQVFLNLLKNAAEAQPNTGRITLRSFYEQSLRLRRDDGSRQSLPLQVEIIDDGPGLPADIAQDVFEPFVSGRENGTGLGLALASRIIADHGGWVSVDSVPGRTVFRISLPIAKT